MSMSQRCDIPATSSSSAPRAAEAKLQKSADYQGPRIAFLASAASIHTARWANEMSDCGYEIHIISMHSPRADDYLKRGKVKFHLLRFGPPWGYVLNSLELRRLLARLKPSLLHTHYAGGYGTLSRLSRFHPVLLSVWGSDVYVAPYSSMLKRLLVERNLRVADYLASTSVAMREQTYRFVSPRREISVTPFGIDCDLFRPLSSGSSGGTFCVGTVKSLEDVYGIDYLIEAFSLVSRRNPHVDMRLLIVGGGSRLSKLKQLSEDFGVAGKTEFVGRMSPEMVPQYLAQMSVFMCLSLSESFGVSVLEASACEIPVIVSAVGGLPEVVRDGITGRVVPPKDSRAAALAIESLLKNRASAQTMGIAGRQWVMQNYARKKTTENMRSLYETILRKHCLQ